jgi:hypothetical protein
MGQPWEPQLDFLAHLSESAVQSSRWKNSALALGAGLSSAVPLRHNSCCASLRSTIDNPALTGAAFNRCVGRIGTDRKGQRLPTVSKHHCAYAEYRNPQKASQTVSALAP